MKNVYLVTYGDYSDYTVMAVFSTEEDATRYAKLLQPTKESNWCRVETWEVETWDSAMERRRRKKEES